MNKLIINSDDFGYSRGINHAVIDAHREGILTSATIMANTPGFKHAVDLAKAHPELGVGVHLVLTHLQPVSDEVPSLIDKNGNFYRPDAYRTGLAVADPEEIFKEWDAQIQKVIQAGIEPTHLDSHHHAHAFNEYHEEVIIRLANKYDLPVRNHFLTDQTYRSTTYFEPSFDTISILDAYETEHYLNRLFDRIKENESTEIMCHVGYVDEELETNSSFSTPRIYQTERLIHSAFAKRVREDEGIQLTTFKEL